MSNSRPHSSQEQVSVPSASVRQSVMEAMTARWRGGTASPPAAQ